MIHSRSSGRLRPVFAAIASSAMLTGLLVGAAQSPAAAANVTSVKGSACSYFTNVGLFGGPQNYKGCGSGVPTSDISFSPQVTLPSSGGAVSQDDATCPPQTPCSPGAKAQYGPAVIHGGIWPEDVNSPTPSGPQHASTSGTLGVSGSVTSSASITLDANPPDVTCTAGFSPPPGHTGCIDPGGFGPPPVWGDSVAATCTANQAGVSGSATFSNSFLATATDAGGAPLLSATEAIPNHPPVNYTRSGVITNVGDVFAVVFNQQIVNPDKSLTVNAVHMYLFGPTAVGELVRGQVNCGTTPSAATSTDTVPPTCGTTVVEPVGPDDPTPKTPRTELIGVFDAGTGAAPTGLTAIDNIRAVNGTVQVGNPSGLAYLQFTPGQTGPLPITAVRDQNGEDNNLPLQWSFDAHDAAGNVTHCHGIIAPYVNADFNGNGTTDISVYRPTNGAWYIPGQANAFWGGVAGDIPVPGDYDGNGTTEIGIYRPSNGAWYIPGKANTFWGGAAGDIPVPADYDGNGTTDIAVFRPSTGAWYVLGVGGTTFWGASGDIPVPADYNGDGKAEIAVYRPSNGAWYIPGQANTFWGGVAGDIPVPGDYNHDNATDIAIFRPSTGAWYVLGVGGTTYWGASGDIPVPGYYGGGATTQIAVFRPSTGAWYVLGGASPYWGASGDIPLPLPAAIRQVFFP